MTDWASMIVTLVRLKERIALLDVDSIFPYTLPAVAADPARQVALEERAGVTLDPGHRSFLAAADGWPAFFETQDLLSGDQLAGGEHRDVFSAWIGSAPAGARAAGFSAQTLLPVAVDLEMPLFAAMPVFDGRVGSRVLSLDPSGIIDDHDSFEAYVASIIAYTERNLADFKSGAYRL